MQQRADVERLIREDMITHAGNGLHPHTHSGDLNSINSNNTNPGQNNPIHPLVEQILPLSASGFHHSDNFASSPSPMLLHEIERYEEENGSSGLHAGNSPYYGTLLNGGVDMTRYSEFTNEDGEEAEEDNINYHRLYTTLSYSALQNRNLDISSSASVTDDLITIQQNHLRFAQKIENGLETEVNKKRERIDEINRERKRRQVEEFKPVNDYLQERWKDGIKNVVELGIETGKQA